MPQSTGPTSFRFRRKELRRYLEQYRVIRDCLAGETAIKAARERYLPKPSNSNDREASSRYRAYLTRAIFYSVAQFTLYGMIGQVFGRTPQAIYPDALKDVVNDITGTGISCDQLAKMSLAEVASIGRGGLFVDYPQTEGDGGATVADMQAGNVRPWVEQIWAEDILNWRKQKVGGIWRTTLVVFQDKYEDDNGFELMDRYQWRVLRLENGIYTLETFLENGSSTKVIPKGPDGQPFNEIPFRFMGPDSNDADVSTPPMYPLCSLNLGHYRNSADYEESVFLVGQPTPWITGVTRDWVQNVWQKNEITLGARSAIVLPSGAAAGLLQAAPNSMPKEAMAMKESQMIAIGAKLIQLRRVQATATEVHADESSNHSVLSSCAVNVGGSVEWALKWCARFIGADENSISYKLNTEFDLVKMTPQEQQQLVASWQADAITYSEMRAGLKRGGYATLDDADAQAETKKYKLDNPAPTPVALVPGDKNNPAALPKPPALKNENPAAQT